MTFTDLIAFPDIDFAAMSSEAKVAAVGFASTVLGAVITTLGSAFGIWGQNANAKRARENYLADRRFDSHLNFLSSANEMLDCARNLGDALKQYDSYTGEQLRELHDKYLISWSRYFISANAVHLAGPKELIENVTDLQDEITEYSDFIDNWYKFRGDATRRAESSVKRDAKVTKVNNARRKYVRKARGLFEKS